MCSHFVSSWRPGSRCSPSGNEVTFNKSAHILTPTLPLKSWNDATNVILFAFIRIYRAKKKEEKKQKEKMVHKIFFEGKMHNYQSYGISECVQILRKSDI